MKNILFNLLNFFFSLFPIKANQLFFIDYYGTNYGDSPRCLSEYIVAKHPELKIVWAFTQPKVYNIPGVRKVKYMSIRFFYKLNTSGVLITNYRMPLFFKKRKSQKYIQTWHSSLRLKKIEKDAEILLTDSYLKMAREDSKKIDLILSGCKFSTNTFQDSFWYDGEVFESGTPRVDRLLNVTAAHISGLKKELGIDENERVVLYCPTFRQRDDDKRFYLDPVKFLENLKRTDGNINWKLLIRYHPHERNSKSGKEIEGILDVTDYKDVQDLMKVADIMVTDYSGVMFDFAYTSKPCFLYVPDLDLYKKKERELYFDIISLPFPVAHTMDELIKLLKDFDSEKYKADAHEFMNRIGSFETGEACKKITEKIIRWVK